jgi:hypothetical protein
MKDTLIQLTDIETNAPMFVDITNIISIKPKMEKKQYHFAEIVGSEIQVQTEDRLWLYSCKEKAVEVNDKRIKKLDEINQDDTPIKNRFEILDI